MNKSEQTSASKREPGYYWVNSDFKKEFRPRYWNGSLWFVGMDVYVGDDFWQEIDERRIERPTPQQQPDTPELTGHDRERFAQWRETNNRFDNIDDMQYQIFEYATIYERSKAQPGELSKAQELVKSHENTIILRNKQLAKIKRVIMKAIKDLNTEDGIDLFQIVQNLEKALKKI